jgi:VWFA-related protein
MTKFRLAVLLTSLLPAGLLLAPQSLDAQDSAESAEPEPFFETVNVNLVNVEVFVTDNAGNSVNGLNRDDFELLDDGNPVTITNFYAVESGIPVSPAALADSAGPEQDQPPNRDHLGRSPIASIPEDQHLHLVVYIDNFNIRPLNRNRIFGRLREFLIEELDPADRVMLVSYDRSLNIRHPFTNDAPSLARTLFTLQKDSGHATQRDNERRKIRRAIEEANAIGEVSGRVRQHASSLDNDLRFTLDALRDMIRTLSGLPGRKALLYVSDGLPMIPGQELFWAVERRFEDISVLAQAHQFNAGRKFQSLAAQANAGRVTFYTIDATGLQAYESGQAEEGRTSSSDTLNTFIDSVATSNLQASILTLAERTGGRAIINANDIGRGMKRIAQDLETYYSLGFNSAHGEDARYHTLEVRLKDKPRGYSVRHREGYRAKPLSTFMIEATESALRYRYERNPLGVRIDLQPSTRYDEKSFAVPVLVHLPLDQIVLIPRGEFHVANLRLYFSVMDEGGDVSDIQQAVVPIEIPATELEEALGKHYTYETGLLMRPGRHAVAVGVRDEMGATSSFVTGQVDVGANTQ